MGEEYIYAVARVRCKERDLLNSQSLDQLLSCSGFDECFRQLVDFGWGTGSEATADEILAAESNKTWDFIREVTDDLSDFDILLYPIDFNNIKAAIKSVVTDANPEHAFLTSGKISTDIMLKAVKERDFNILPGYISDVAERAYRSFLQTQDGQLCDAIIDKACLEGILKSGENSDNEILARYAEMSVATANIKIAVRSCITKKSVEFIRESMARCATLDADRLIVAAGKELDDVYTYLSHTDYAEASELIKESYTAFEKWCDNKIMSLIKSQKFSSFTVGPLFAYVVARQNEINMVRIILLGKQNEIDDNLLKERLRELYV